MLYIIDIQIINESCFSFRIIYLDYCEALNYRTYLYSYIKVTYKERIKYLAS